MALTDTLAPRRLKCHFCGLLMVRQVVSRIRSSEPPTPHLWLHRSKAHLARKLRALCLDEDFEVRCVVPPTHATARMTPRAPGEAAWRVKFVKYFVDQLEKSRTLWGDLVKSA